jgi:hypothetical protein
VRWPAPRKNEHDNVQKSVKIAETVVCSKQTSNNNANDVAATAKRANNSKANKQQNNSGTK